MSKPHYKSQVIVTGDNILALEYFGIGIFNFNTTKIFLLSENFNLWS